jgi:mono/diheme cytochrome c family protein
VRKLIIGLAALAICALGVASMNVESRAAGADWTMPPTKAVERYKEKGSLHSPYEKDYEKYAEEGHKLYMGLSCNGCHGGSGGGGMCPPLTNSVWVYGSDDDTLFRLVTEGSQALQDKYGMSRVGSENVVGPMPGMGSAIKTSDDLWKIIAWIRSINPSSIPGGGSSVPPPPTFD